LSSGERADRRVEAQVQRRKCLREVARASGVDEEMLDKALDYRAMARPHG
jgi:hypothetical protein